MLRVFIGDPHPVIRYGIRQALRNVTVVGEASTAEELLQRLANSRSDILILEFAMSEENGLSLISTIRSRYPQLPILIFSRCIDFHHIRQAFACGAAGYVVKTAPLSQLTEAVPRVLGGRTYVSPPYDEADFRSQYDDKPLSRRELEVLHLLATGQRTAEIATAYQVSPKTIMTYVSRMKHKLQLSSTSELIRYAIKDRLQGRRHTKKI